MRVILIIGVFATLYTGAYGLYVAAQKGFDEADGKRSLMRCHLYLIACLPVDAARLKTGTASVACAVPACHYRCFSSLHRVVGC